MADSTNKAQNIKTAPGFDVNGGGAAFGNPNFTRQGIRAGATQFVKPSAPAKAPPKAPAAPTGRTGYLFTGLAEALNTYQNDLVKRKIYSIADVYEFAFDPDELGACTIKKPGSTDKSKTAGKKATTVREAKDPKTDSVNKNSQNWSIQPGTQIVQAIDQIMRSSSLITDQALYQVDPLTQKIIPGKGTGTGVTVWFHISVGATIIGYDAKRRDNAYRMKFTITPYAITQMASEYFPDSAYRGSHKSYNYWFTGQNTQILNLEQTYDNQYYLTLTGGAPTDGGPTGKKGDLRDLRDQYAKTAMPTSSEKTGQQTGTYTNSAADSAADFFYDSKDFSKLNMRVIGDPAFLFESRVETGLNSNSFDFRPFNDDGGINFHSQAVVIDVGWNHPQDYNMDTGVVPTTNVSSSKSEGHQVYQVISVRSFFTRGKFEQEIQANMLVEYNKGPVAEVVRPAAKIKPKPKVKYVPDNRVDFVGQSDPLGGTRDNPMSFAVNSFLSA